MLIVGIGHIDHEYIEFQFFNFIFEIFFYQKQLHPLRQTPIQDDSYILSNYQVKIFILFDII